MSRYMLIKALNVYNSKVMVFGGIFPVNVSRWEVLRIYSSIRFYGSGLC